jgi:hypothetical protein
VEIVILWLVFAVLVGMLAAFRGRSGVAWFLIAVLISPLLGLLFVAVLPSLAIAPGTPTPQTHVKCPDCRELVLKEARVCKHCGLRLVPQAEEGQVALPPAQPSGTSVAAGRSIGRLFRRG